MSILYNGFKKEENRIFEKLKSLDSESRIAVANHYARFCKYLQNSYLITNNEIIALENTALFWNAYAGHADKNIAIIRNMLMVK